MWIQACIFGENNYCSYRIYKFDFRPCEMFCNPLLHESIEVELANKVDANHMMVVYKRLKDSDVQRRIIQGPTVFVPEAEEW